MHLFSCHSRTAIRTRIGSACGSVKTRPRPGAVCDSSSPRVRCTRIPSVGPHVHRHTATGGERSKAQFALERLLSRVRPHVSRQIPAGGKRPETYLAREQRRQTFPRRTAGHGRL